MKDKQVACLLLLILVAGLVYGTQKTYKMMMASRAEAAENVSAAQTAKLKFSTVQVALNRLKAETQGLREFHAAWEPFFQATGGPQGTEQAVIDSVKSADVFAVSQRFELLDRKNDPYVKNILRAHLTIEDEYSKVFNWLADLEEAIPTSRVTSCKLLRGAAGDDIHLELIVDLPIIGGKKA